MADGRLWFNTKIDNTGVEKDLKDLERKIKQSQETISKAENAKLPLVKQLDEAKKKLNEARATLASYKTDLADTQAASKSTNQAEAMAATAALPEARAMVAAQEKEVAKLQKSWDGANNKVADYDRKIQQANADIERSKSKAAELTAQLNSSGAKMQAAFDKARNSANRFEKRMLEIAKSALVFNVVSSVLRGVVNYMGKVLKSNSEYTAQLAKLKGALLTAFQPIYEFILPGVLVVLRVLTAIAQVIANVLSFLFGKTAKESAKNAKALNAEAEAIDGVGKSAKKAQKSLAGFDEINTLGSTKSKEGNIGGGGGSSAIKPDFTDFNTEEYKAKIDELTVYLSGALLAIGAILAFSGVNIPLGIALMAAGALGMASVVKENWGAMSAELEGAIAKVMFFLGGAALVIGAILTFSGTNIPLGIGLMVAGAAAVWGAAKINWDSVANVLKNPVAMVAALLSTFLLVLGAILAFSGANLKLGVALMAAGAIGLVTVAALDWNAIQNKLRGPVGVVVAIASGALLALGLILAFTGVNLPLGIALIAAGAAGLVTVSFLNWNNIATALQGPIGKVVAIASGALLALGLILAFTGANLPLGIAMIVAGAAGLVTVSALNWNGIKDKLSSAWSGIKNWFKTSVAPKLTLTYWKDKFSNISDGLKQKIKDGINGAITLFNKFISWINRKMNFSWSDKYLLGQKIISAGSIQLFTIPQIPMLAQGAVIPPNAPFMAMLGDQKHGTNIEAPLSTIQEAVAAVMQDYSAANLAGHEATVAVLREILEAVLGIEVGDEVIAKAVNRYNVRLATMRGDA